MAFKCSTCRLWVPRECNGHHEPKPTDDDLAERVDEALRDARTFQYPEHQ